MIRNHFEGLSSALGASSKIFNGADVAPSAILTVTTTLEILGHRLAGLACAVGRYVQTVFLGSQAGLLSRDIPSFRMRT
jgi:hypothetical protein